MFQPPSTSWRAARPWEVRRGNPGLPSRSRTARRCPTRRQRVASHRRRASSRLRVTVSSSTDDLDCGKRQDLVPLAAITLEDRPLLPDRSACRNLPAIRGACRASPGCGGRSCRRSISAMETFLGSRIPRAEPVHQQADPDPLDHLIERPRPRSEPFRQASRASRRRGRTGRSPTCSLSSDIMAYSPGRLFRRVQRCRRRFGRGNGSAPTTGILPPISPARLKAHPLEPRVVAGDPGGTGCPGLHRQDS